MKSRLPAIMLQKKSGGKGAVRELIEIILKSQDLWHKVTGEYAK